MAKAEPAQWAGRVHAQLAEHLPPGAEVIEPFLREHGFTVSVPLKGLGFGNQLAWLNRRNMKSAATDLDRFYHILGKLAAAPSQGKRLAECDGRASWAPRGVYFFLEHG